ncbi:TNF receptor-associated factor 4-like [Dysidea avara]|uniref:TNF receptor-associated factor 4-like n=1 Tax=Dysidea avara TaxID=196820 RepID=UPI0033226781
MRRTAIPRAIPSLRGAQPCLGGYDYQFIDTPPDRVICNICHLPSRDPYLTTCCGHVLCNSCLDNSKRVSVVCPVCRAEEFMAYINKQLDRELKSLHVMCSNKESGCEWQGVLNDIKYHLENIDGCLYENVKCFNQCGEILQRRYLINHVEAECPRRKVNCKYCHILREHQFIEGKHKQQCPKLPLPCPNKCIQNIPREDMEAHRRECPLEIVQCSNMCQKRLQRQYLTKHVENECPRRQVYCQYCLIIGEHYLIESCEHRAVCPEFPVPCPNNCGAGSVPREDMEAHKKECPLEMVQCEYHNVGCKERMMRKEVDKHEEENMKDHLSMTKLELNKTKDQLTSVIEHIGIVVHQLQIDHKQNLQNQPYLPRKPVRMEMIQGSTQLQPSVITQSTAISNTVISNAKWSVELLATTASCNTHDQVCPVIIKIHGLKDATELYSNSFYTHGKGYKMCLSVDPDGDGDSKGTHMSVYLYLMKGPHDDMLTWPLRGKIELKLLNQISDCEHRSLTLAYNDNTTTEVASQVTNDDRATTGWGYPQFISKVVLHRITPTCRYLKNDCIFLQVSKL